MVKAAKVPVDSLGQWLTQFAMTNPDARGNDVIEEYATTSPGKDKVSLWKEEVRPRILTLVAEGFLDETWAVKRYRSENGATDGTPKRKKKNTQAEINLDDVVEWLDAEKGRMQEFIEVYSADRLKDQLVIAAKLKMAKEAYEKQLKELDLI